MRPRFRLALSLTAGVLAALLMGAFAVTLSARSSQERDSAIEEYGGRLTKVLVATKDIKAGSRVTSGMCEQRKWVSELLPADALRSAVQLRGAKASTAIYAGEPIVKMRLEPQSGGLEVPRGLVAVSVPVQTDLAVGGAIRGGDRVSIVVYDGTDGAKRLADDVLVLATNIESEGREARGIFSSGGMDSTLTWTTLAVPPQLELPLINVSERGRIHLTMHGEADGDGANGGAQMISGKPGN